MRSRPAAPHTVPGGIAAVGALFAASGAAGLAFQIAWSKALGLVLGNSYAAIATVVAAFLCGLSLGAWLGGRVPFLVRRPLRAYGLLEVAIGLFGFASLPLVRGLETALVSVAGAVEPGTALFATIGVVLVFVLLLPPTVLMGATLPLLVQWAWRRSGRFAGSVSLLYALNTLGAVVGALASGFVLVPWAGISGTVMGVSCVGLAVGGLVLLASRRFEAARPAESPPAPSGRPRSAAVVVAMVAASGAVALTLEMGWTRQAGLLFGSSVYSFSIVLAAFLLGIALGAAVAVPFVDRIRSPWFTFAALQWGVAAGALWSSARIARMPWDLAAAVASAGDSPGAVWSRQALLLMSVVLPTTLALGALFPLAVRLLARPGEDAAPATGRLYLANTLGTMAGSLASGLYILPAAGTRSTLLGAALVAAAVGSAAWWMGSAGRGRRWARAVVPLGAVALAWGVGRLQDPWDTNLLAAGLFRPAVAAGDVPASPQSARAKLRARLEQEEVVFQREGRHALVTVHRARSNPLLLALRVNGKTDASTGRDIPTQILLGLIPMLHAPDAARVFVVGHGSGLTTGAVLSHAPARVDVAEIEAAVLEASRWFDPWSGAPLDDPRVRVLVDDARSLLRYRPATYDVIVSEPSNPWLAGVNNLFTEESYRLFASRLAPGGVLCQWVQFYELSPESLASILRAVRAAFPYGEVFFTGADLLVIAGREPLHFDDGRVQARLALPKVAADLRHAGLASWDELKALRLADLDHAIAQLPASPRNTDDRPFVEYRAPRDFYTVRPGRTPVPPERLVRPDPVWGPSRWQRGG